VDVDPGAVLLVLLVLSLRRRGDFSCCWEFQRRVQTSW
jgi:hypothetical protein